MLRLSTSILVLPANAQSPPIDQRQADDVRTKLTVEVRNLATQGYGPGGPEVIEQLSRDASKRIPIQLIKGIANAIVAACDENCDRVELALYDYQSNLIAKAPQNQGVVIINGVPTFTGYHVVELSASGCHVANCYAGVLVVHLPNSTPQQQSAVDLVKPPAPPVRPVFDHYVVGLDMERADWVTLRRSPDPSDLGLSEIQIGLDTPVAVLEERDTFKLIKLRSGETGWVYSRNVSCCRDQGSVPTYHYAANLCSTCADGWLALRSLTNPRTEWRQNPKIWPGTIFTVLGQRGEFQLIRLQSGETGLVTSSKVACCR
jgi:hypothetical protein